VGFSQVGTSVLELPQRLLLTVYAITDTKKGRTGIAPTYLQVGAGAAGAAGAAFSNTVHVDLYHFAAVGYYFTCFCLFLQPL